MIEDIRTLWLVSMGMGVLIELSFFLFALTVRDKAAYALVILGFVPSLLIGVALPAWATSVLFNA